MREVKEIEEKIKQNYDGIKVLSRSPYGAEGIAILEASIRSLKWALGEDNPEV